MSNNFIKTHYSESQGKACITLRYIYIGVAKLNIFSSLACLTAVCITSYLYADQMQKIDDLTKLAHQILSYMVYSNCLNILEMCII